jgi:hypothetical protein
MLLSNREFAAKDFQWTGYDYAVPGQHQGTFEHLRVIGDKRAGNSTNRLREHPDLLDRLRDTAGVPLRIIHVVRNPYDTTATMARRLGWDLSAAIDHYARLAATVDQVRARLAPDELLDLRYETFSEHPEQQLSDLCRFVGVSTTPDYLRACATIVRSGESRSRDGLTWSTTDQMAIDGLVASRPVLAGYSLTN